MTILARLWAHMRSLWPRYTLLPGLPFVLWPGYCLAIGERRWELLAAGLFGAVTPYIGPRAKKLWLGILPIGLLGLLYDSMRFVKTLGITPERVHICDLRDLELRYFGIGVGGERITVQDWLQPRATPVADVILSIPYGTFFWAVFVFAVFLYFRDYGSMRRFTASLLALNIAAFVTYHLYPAAPPWYFHSHGCVADLAAHASEGPNLARVDHWLGYAYFGGFYGRSNDVFGAMPSLHVAYPLLLALEGWQAFGPFERFRFFTWPLRIGSIVFFAMMCVAAVYLDHHWIFDVIVGIGYGLAVFVSFRVASRVRDARARLPSPERVDEGPRRVSA